MIGTRGRGTRLVATLVAALLLAGCAGTDLDQLAQDLADALSTESADATAPTPPATPSAASPTAATQSPSTNADPTAPPEAVKAPPFAPPPDAEPATVVRIVDGDTLILRFGPDDDERVRLLRIDTPELSRDGQPAECLALAATEQLTRFAPPGTNVLIATDVEIRDQFGRLLAHVWRADDGIWINGGMLATGYAKVVTFPPNVTWDREVLALQGVAQDQGKGLWSAC